jgi:hypothetical protein
MRDYVVVERRDVREEVTYFVTASSKAAARESYKNGEGSLLREERVEVLDKWVAAVYDVPQLRVALPWPAAKRAGTGRARRGSHGARRPAANSEPRDGR